MEKLLELHLDLHETTVPEDDDRRKAIWSQIMKGDVF